MTNKVIPRHIGYIVDGNRRWAKKHGLPAYEGHLAGYNTVQDVIAETFKYGVEFISAYVFSTENWRRSKKEVNKFMSLALRALTSDLHIFVENNVRVKVLGSRKDLKDSIIKAINNAEEKTADNTGGTFAICFNYGGQLEIVDAVKKIVESKVASEDVSVDLISQNIYSPEIPPIDLIVRTSGEKRISNFMLWRSAYSEIMFIDKLWPDITKDDVADIIDKFSLRARRFGG
ncbi:MAG TPA: polyprenyl diphosphate synthase [Candidatus Saccharimonadales bacterium]|nr:polyprenyl diphosphate synthase [Candidatus Saccharimonadales bacterium]